MVVVSAFFVSFFFFFVLILVSRWVICSDGDFRGAVEL